MSNHASLDEIINQTAEQHPKQQALSVLIQGIRLAQERGIFSLAESNILAEKIMVFVDHEHKSTPTDSTVTST